MKNYLRYKQWADALLWKCEMDCAPDLPVICVLVFDAGTIRLYRGHGSRSFEVALSEN